MLADRSELLRSIEGKMMTISADIYQQPQKTQLALIEAYREQLEEEPRSHIKWDEFESDDDNPPTPMIYD
ncbi:hypothetical protein N7478_013071 [Penicillium angulare]|uniref:uncharacterized protein n=1 Tax=Penicillium angulare TaxID=116970 RepID=UPI0025413543|nr:uncharacterized protein N7478_013071 [Penicillium angulare]KAJ5256967.1 hypothetical protein N7478_013071 [Penicillium angulare]